MTRLQVMIYIDKFTPQNMLRLFWHWRSSVNEFYLSSHSHLQKASDYDALAMLLILFIILTHVGTRFTAFDSAPVVFYSSLICHSFQNNFTCFVLNDTRSRVALCARMFVLEHGDGVSEKSPRIQTRTHNADQVETTHTNLFPFSSAHAISPAVNSCYLCTFLTRLTEVYILCVAMPGNTERMNRGLEEVGGKGSSVEYSCRRRV